MFFSVNLYSIVTVELINQVGRAVALSQPDEIPLYDKKEANVHNGHYIRGKREGRKTREPVYPK